MTAPVNPGDLLAGKYQVERVLGVGGMGVVVVATHLQLEERVAIKFLLPDALQNAEAVARFAREARAACKIRSEHVARVVDVSTLETGAPYMVMEYLEGHDLQKELELRGALSVEDATDFVLQACEALAEAHTGGIVHRDLKPANLFLTHRADGSPCVKVLDFGISKVGGKSGSASDASMTKTTAMMGSPLYMSPEQLKSTKDVDQRADVWAMGIILSELLTGKPVFQGETMPQLCAAILTEPPIPLTHMRPDAPRGLEQTVAKCLEKDPQARFQNVGELALALAEFAPQRSMVSVERITRVIQGAGAAVRPPMASIASFEARGSGSSITGSGQRSSSNMAPRGPTTTGGFGGGASTGSGLHGAAVPAGTMAAFGGTQPAPRGSRAPAVVALSMLAMFLLAGLGGLYVFVLRPKPTDSTAAAATQQAARGLANPPPAPSNLANLGAPSPPVVTDPVPAPSASAAVVTPTDPSPASSSVVARPKPVTPSARPAAAPRPAAKANTTSDFGDRK